MKLVFEECRSAAGRVTVKSIAQILKDEDKVFNEPDTHPVQNSFPEQDDMDEELLSEIR